MTDMFPQFKFILRELPGLTILDDMPGPVALRWVDGKQVPIAACSFKFEDATFNIESFREFMRLNQFTVVAPYKAYRTEIESGEIRIVVRGYFA